MSSPPTSAPVSGAPQPGFDLRSVAGLFGILLAAMMAGLNGRLPGLVPVDIQGGLGFGRDEAAWITTAYSAGELAAMPFASWFAITFSMRRFHLTMLAISLTLSVILPLVQDLRLLLALRVLQGIASGSLIPILMMALLRFLPLPIRLYGLAIFALTATFTPNVALWLAAWCVDHLEDWRWLYWNVIPLGLAAMALVVRGVPNAPPMLERLKQANWLGMALGMPGLALLVAGIDQGVRLDWFNSPSIIVALGAGVVLTALFLLGESLHPLPFIQLQLLQRRNVWLGLLILVCLFMLFASGVSLPASVLGHMQGFRMPQSAKLGLIVGLPQLALGPCVALLLYRRWVDARHVFAMGLSFIALACWLASGITGEWMVPQFFWPQVLQAMGQAMAVVSSLFLVTSVIQPMEGPFIAGFINILRVISTTLASAGIGQFTAIRGRFHSEMLLDNAGHLLPRLASPDSVLGTLGQTVFQQASILAAADVYRAFAVLALLMIPAVLNLKRIHPPAAHPPQAICRPGQRDPMILTGTLPMTPTTRYRIFIGVAVVLVLLAAFCLLNRPESSSATQSTDDAYVQADFTAVVPQVAGVITELAVNDHQQVKAGDPLVDIDDRKLHIAVDIANAAIDSLQARLEQQRSTISQARAAVAAARSNLKLAETNRSRFANLARDGSGTVQAQQQAEAEWETRRASLDRERAGLQAADRQIAVLQADLKKAKAAKADADLNLSHAHVTAPVGGIVDQRRARVGGYARVGEPLLTLVPLDAVYIEANFRETQLARMRVGQPADITVDALPGVKLKGRVESLAPASGVSYSAVPAHNATGNFTKITQRLPIRIQIEPNQKDAKLLRVGMSAHPSIQVKE